MKNQLKREHIENALETFSRYNPELKQFKLVNADGRLGKRVALAKEGDMGALYVKTDYMTFAEMNRFLHGYSIKGEKRFEPKTEKPDLLEALKRLDNAAMLFADDHAHYYETGNTDKINSMLAELHNAHLAAKAAIAKATE